MKRFIVVFISLICSFTAFADTLSFNHLVDSAKMYRIKSFDGKDNPSRYADNASFTKLLKRIISEQNKWNAYQGNLDSVLFISTLNSSDGIVKLISWDIPLKGGGVEYSCLVWKKDKKNYSLTELDDQQATFSKRVVHKTITDKTWYGAMYFEMIPVKGKKENYYLLFGINKSNPLTRHKVIDVLTFNSTGGVVLGKDVFKMKSKTQKRVLVSYSPKAHVSLTYEPKKNRVVYDHLIPEKSYLVGKFQYYVPDFSFDALVFEKGKWIYTEDVDFRGKSNDVNPPVQNSETKNLYEY